MTMRKYKESFAAGATLQFEHPGGFFRVLRTAFPINVEFVRDFRPVDRADGIDSGMWYETAGEFDSVRITNTGPRAQDVEFLLSRGRAGIDAPEVGLPTLVMEAGVNPVTPGGSVPGWVSGDIASLAASGSVSVIFDLGPHWDRYGMAAVAVTPNGPSSGLNAVQVFGSDSTAYDFTKRLGHAFGTGWTATHSNLTTANGPMQSNVRPSGRYLIIQAANADAVNAQGVQATVIVSAYPHS